ncbi:uncharacterized protein LOC110744316 [Prunus avium]|uniref:Uncharacterized protein LOC110744316 n=1 Tax=Prunus avium TaxID=42229 RepID=A0A6P5RAM9_PRUAV|nr:uncharacterized protein LOC110744316 [Prunus avium]
MGTTAKTTFVPQEGMPFGMPSGVSPAPPPYTPATNSPVLQTTENAELLAQVVSLRQDMARLLDRAAERQTERQGSPIRKKARLDDPRLRSLGRRSPIRRIPILESSAEFDQEYAPSTNRSSSYRSATPTKFSEVNPVRSQQRQQSFLRDPVICLLLQRVQEMEDERTRSQEPDWGRLRLGPFIERIRRSRQDRDVQTLRISAYTGVEDPLTHLHSFQSAVGCLGLSDEGQCMLFPSSLTEAALNWFYHLEPGIVDSFDELKQIFLNHFMIQTDRLHSADDLYTIRQRDDEPLRE